MNILITGAGGKTGRHVIAMLQARGATVRAWLRSSAHARALAAQGVETIIGDMMTPALWPQALAGIDAIYHIAPNMFPQEVALGQLAIEAARQSRVRRFVYHSVLHPQTEAMPHHWHKLQVEAALLASDLSFTILQPTAYMQNLLVQWPELQRTGILRQPYAPEARISLVDLRDVAEVAANVLLQPGHEAAIYELVGTAALSQHEVAQILGQALGRPVRAERLSRALWAQRASGLSDYARETLLKMFDYYEHFGMAGNPHVLTWLLGRPPRSLLTFAQEAS